MLTSEGCNVYYIFCIYIFIFNLLFNIYLMQYNTQIFIKL